jgi:hypothetical protein
MKNEVIYIEQREQNEKPVEFTHQTSNSVGWVTTSEEPLEYKRVVYLGKCDCDGDMFAAYDESGAIIIFKGHLNSGKY